MNRHLLLLAGLALGCHKDEGQSDDSSKPVDDSTAHSGDTGDPTHSGDSGGGDDSPPPDDSEPPPAPTIADVQTGVIASGEVVTLSGVVMTSPNTGSGFFIGDPAGGPYSGLWVYHRGILEFLDAAPGDSLTISGVVQEYAIEGYEGGLTELEITSIADATVDGPGTLPVPVVLSPADLMDPVAAEPYEGVLVSVHDVTVTATDDDFGEWKVDDALVVDDLFYTVEDLVGVLGTGDTFTALTGPLNYSYGTFKLEPRDESDIEGYTRYCGAERCIDDLGTGDLVLTEFMANPDFCDDPNGEYIEVYNATDSAVDLFGLEISDATTTVTLDEHAIVDAYGYAWLANGTSETLFCYASAGEPDAYYAASLALNNDGESLILGYTGGATSVIIDQVIWTADEVERAASTGLSGAVLNATDNDDMQNWCPQVEAIGEATDLGSPGAENPTCDDD